MESKQAGAGVRRGGARTAVLAGHRPVDASLQARLRIAFEHMGGWIGERIATETARRTWFNFLPVAFGIGIGAYFLADREPLWWGPALACVSLALVASARRSRPVDFAILIALTMISAGIWASQLRTARVAAPMIDRIMIGQLSGFIQSVEERTDDARMVLRVTAFAGLPPGSLPERVRFTLRKGEYTAGEHIDIMARLSPPPEPARPGGYNFARDAFFRGLGGIGAGLGAPTRSPAPYATPLDLRIAAAIDDARNAMTQRIAGLIGGQTGAVAAALVTGKRGLISEETNDALRAAGLYHIVSISGLHMVLAAGSIFWLVRGLLALSATAALRWPLKKIAAASAMFGATAYCIFSGAEVATVRSLYMTLVMLGAILVDRPALSMRNLAIAALMVLAIEPDALLGPSFQMSFGAVAALIAFAEWSRRRTGRDPPPGGIGMRLMRKLWLAIAGLFITSVLAMLATSPFGAFHFQTYNPFGLAGNMLALPFVSLGVMPAAVIGALLYPLGLDGLAWWVMGLATAPVLAVSHHIASFGGSTQVIPAFGAPAVVMMGLALLLATLLTTSLRCIALAPLAGGLLLAGHVERPDILIDREGRGVAVRTVDGRLTVIGRPGSFVVEQWLRSDGDNRKPDDPGLLLEQLCDPAGCTALLPDGRSVAWSRQAHAVAEDCTRADIVVTPLRWAGACAALMVDKETLDRFGSISVKVAPGTPESPGTLTTWTTRDSRITRPWSRHSPQRSTDTAPPSDPATEPQINSDERD